MPMAEVLSAGSGSDETERAGHSVEDVVERLGEIQHRAGSGDEHDLVGGSRYGDVRLRQHHTKGTTVARRDGHVFHAVRPLMAAL